MTVLVKTELWEEHTTPVPLSCIPSELIWEEEMYTCSHTFLSNLQLMHCILMLKDLGTEIKIPFASGFPLLPEREKLEKSYELFLVWDSIPFYWEFVALWKLISYNIPFSRIVSCFELYPKMETPMRNPPCHHAQDYRLCPLSPRRLMLDTTIEFFVLSKSVINIVPEVTCTEFQHIYIWWLFYHFPFTGHIVIL